MPIELPKIKVENNTQYVFCYVRKKWIVVTPEEMVRQFTIFKLVNYFQFPLQYISVEKSFTVHTLIKRYDIVAYNTHLQPILLVECKAEHVEINQHTLQQIATYNITLQVPYLMVTNGKAEFYFEVKGDKCNQIKTLPFYEVFI